MPDGATEEKHLAHQIDGQIHMSFKGLDCLATLLCRCGEPICGDIEQTVISAAASVRAKHSAHTKEKVDA